MFHRRPVTRHTQQQGSMTPELSPRTSRISLIIGRIPREFRFQMGKNQDNQDPLCVVLGTVKTRLSPSLALDAATLASDGHDVRRGAVSFQHQRRHRSGNCGRPQPPWAIGTMSIRSEQCTRLMRARKKDSHQINMSPFSVKHRGWEVQRGRARRPGQGEIVEHEATSGYHFLNRPLMRSVRISSGTCWAKERRDAID
jgi:hypothetical protein